MTEVVTNEDAARALPAVKAKALEGFTPAPRPDPATETHRYSNAKEGLDYDNCANPDCGARDLEPTYHIGNRSVAFRCDCCGNMHWRETREGHEYNMTHGLGRYSAERQVTSAQVGRYVSTPSAAFRRNYERAFGHK